VLGTLYRAKVTGLVRLTEMTGAVAGRTHGIYLSRGEVVAVDTPARVPAIGDILRQRGLLDGAAQRQLGLRLAADRNRKVGEVLVEECRLSPDVVGAALRQQLRARLDALFALEDALLSFHVACVQVRDPVPPLAPREYLHGRPRARDRASPRGARAPDVARRRTSGKHTEALTLLGLDEDASLSDVTRAFRDLASRFHPDRHLDAPENVRRLMQQRFASLSAAYHTLID
jgi:hypothetical protein